MIFAIEIRKPYLWIPVKKQGEKKLLTIAADQEKITEVMVPIANKDSCDFYATIGVRDYQGKTLLFDGIEEESFYQGIRQEESRYETQQVNRPEIHFTANTGWINDPNGLVYQDGVYHLYFQYNPFDVEWDNMSWGHAVSKDLLHWTQLDTVMWPDEEGMMFSGSGIRNERKLLNLPEAALLFYYSAAGGTTPWSKEKLFTQRLAYSLDHGKTLKKEKTFVVPTIEKENRDPKVFWHEESKAYIMVLWLKDHEFAILRSTNLTEFTISQRLILEDAFECPDLFPLSVEGEREKKWVFWCADGFYYVGDFDGFTFTLEQGKRCGYQTHLPYAAQTIAGVIDRMISIPWLRAKFLDRPYTGAMGIPRELGLLSIRGAWYLQQPYCQEYRDARRKRKKIQLTSENTIQIGTVTGVTEIEVSSDTELSGRINILLGDQCLHMDFDKKQIQYKEDTVFLHEEIPLKDFSLLIDETIIELTAQNATIYIVYELPEQPLTGKIELQSVQGTHERNINIYELEKEK
ncbi:glycoside hydrolase family 32 protein [Anaerosporobacter faecicola]|uniref:glycoside hydrolase family 32 protein n=1 Tax=Anaerosporobacter faecicola TaxID=2718714 RepID=UPI00143A53AE|nr:glycoside hydrolase family 32 protein [Anaerosporobacter faecicola]